MITTNNTYHIPVLLKESIDGLNINPDGIYVDVTFGGGSHSRAILKELNKGSLFAFDQDESAKKNIINDKRFVFIHANFTYIKNFLELHGIQKLDGIIADLGISSYQIDTPERGFSTRFDAMLDLRMNQNDNLTGAYIINNYDIGNLKRIFKDYGELNNAQLIAKRIIKIREIKPIETTTDLNKAIEDLCSKNKINKFLAQVFQALRIEVNAELDALKNFLNQSKDLLKTGGRLVVISYHSLEDRLVKNFMRSGNFNGAIEEDFYGNKIVPFELINKKPIGASDIEIKTNKRSRSAKLRIAKKI